VRRTAAWLKRHVPTQESLQRQRLLRPFARQLGNPALWRMHRRSVPRGVAIGLFVGVMIPFMHTLIAALVAIPARANIAVAAVVTLLINPLTIPPLYYAAYRLGSWELHYDSALISPTAAARVSGELSRILFWVHEASGPIAVGILTIAVIAATTGYLAASIGWRWWLGSKWRERRQMRLAGRESS
jgi:uncharacterized protein (DUF2062 family)